MKIDLFIRKNITGFYQHSEYIIFDCSGEKIKAKKTNLEKLLSSLFLSDSPHKSKEYNLEVIKAIIKKLFY